MQNFFKLDGKYYNLAVESLKREAAILDGPDAGRLMNGNMTRDIIGTYYNYSMVIDTSETGKADYDTFFETITAPVDYHTVSFPYGQQMLTFKAYVANVSDELEKVTGKEQLWKGLNVKFTAMMPQRRPE